MWGVGGGYKKAVCMCQWLSLCTVTFKNLATVSLPSMMNLMFLWKEFKASE